MASLPRASRLRRALSYASALATFLFLSSCASDTTGVGSPGFGSLQVIPKWSSLASRAPVVLNRVQAIVERVTFDTATESSSRDTLVNTSRNFSPSNDELRLSLRVPLQGSSEQLTVTLLYFADQTLLFTGTEVVEVSTGSSASASQPEMIYVGPGSDAVGLIIEPFDTTVTAGSVTPFRAVAINGQENDVGPFYMRWTISSSANGASIDASGRLRAPTQPGTLWVIGNLPNGVDDSVQVIVTGTPGAITIVSGNHQTGQAGSGLELPLVVRVTGSGGAPIQGVTVNWAATIGGGNLEVGTTTTDANGESENFASLGPNPGVNAFTATVAGAGSVTFLANENLTGSTIAWLGNTSDVWSNAANWVGGVVPSFLDSVVITSGQFFPVLDTTPGIGALTLGGEARLTLNNHGLVVVRNLTLLGSSSLIMTNPSDVITVGGNAVFNGGDTRGNLTAGVISIVGNFTQRSDNSSASFSASGEHIVSLAGQNSTVSFESPGLASSSSGFQEFFWSSSSGGTLTLNSNVFVRGQAVAGFSGASTISSTGGHNLRAAQLQTSAQIPLVFNNVTLTLQDTAAADYSLSLLTFQNMPTNRPQLELNYAGGGMVLSGFVFATTPVAPNGYYISAADVQVGDGDVLTIDVTATPSSPGAFVATSGAVVNWPGLSSVRVRR